MGIILHEPCLRIPTALARVDARVDDPVFFAVRAVIRCDDRSPYPDGHLIAVGVLGFRHRLVSLRDVDAQPVANRRRVILDDTVQIGDPADASQLTPRSNESPAAPDDHRAR